MPVTRTLAEAEKDLLDIRLALLVDVLLLLSSLWFILEVTERSIFNPSLAWVALHAYTITFRLISLNLGVESLPIIGVRSNSELVNAAIASDISLMGVVAATIFVAQRALHNKAIESSRSRAVELNSAVGQVISVLCLTIGTYFLLKFGYAATAARARGLDISAIDIGQFNESSYPIAIAGFAVQGALIQVAMRGFTRWRIILLSILLVLTSFNLARTSFVLAAALAFLIFQTRRNKTNVPVKWLVAFMLLSAVWFVLKPVRAAINEDQSVDEIIASAQNYLYDTVGGKSSGDMQFFDMEATYMAAADEEGKRFHGSTVLPLLYLPIPRFLWPDKPRMNEYAFELASALRPVTQVGMITLLSGESYLNFGWAGCAIIPFLYLFGMLSGYRRVKCHGITSAPRLLYLVFLVSMVQVFRDGLVSLVMYPFVTYLPLVAWAVISRVAPANAVSAPRLNSGPLWPRNTKHIAN